MNAKSLLKQKFLLITTLFVSCALCSTLNSCGGDDESDGTSGKSGGSPSDGNSVIGVPEGLKAVDLGIIVNGKNIKWANMNVGATSESDYGDFFAWGETTGYSSATEITDGREFSWATYKWCNGTANTLTKYCTDNNYGTVDNKTTLEAADDAATANWGGSWRIPTIEEWNALFATKENTRDYTWTRELRGNHHWGFTVKHNPTGNYIFLPQAGTRSGKSSNIHNQFSNGCYWSSSLFVSSVYGCRYAYHFRLYVNTVQEMHGIDRYEGLSVRAVQSE